jgi:hypothetical protein
MGQIRAYFDRIQGRLLAAFIMALLGTVTIFLIGYRSLSELGTSLTVRSDTIGSSSDVAMRLETSVLDQIATGEHYLISSSPETEAAFDSLHNTVAHLTQQFRMLDLDQSGRDQLDRASDLHARIEQGYRRAHVEYAGGQRDVAIARVEALGPTVAELRAIIRALNTGQVGRAAALASDQQIGFLTQRLGISARR